VSRLGSLVAPLALWAYAAVVFVLGIPSVLSRSLLWEFSLAIVVIVAVPTAVMGALMLAPVYRRGIAVLALAWMVLVTLGWLSSNTPLVIVSMAVTVAVFSSVIQRFRAAAASAKRPPR
jgi:hypothetical protein